MVRPRCQLTDARQTTDLLVDAAQHFEHVVPLDPRVMAHLVVAEKIRVDRMAAGDHVLADGSGDDVAGYHRRNRPDDRIDPAATDPRPHVVAALPGSGDHFPANLDQVHDSGPSGVDQFAK